MHTGRPRRRRQSATPPRQDVHDAAVTPRRRLENVARYGMPPLQGMTLRSPAVPLTCLTGPDLVRRRAQATGWEERGAVRPGSQRVSAGRALAAADLSLASGSGTAAGGGEKTEGFMRSILHLQAPPRRHKYALLGGVQ